jgi:hypothetical protein
MATQTVSARALLPWIPIRMLRLRVARAIAYRRALRQLARVGLRGAQASLLAGEISGRIRD